MSIDGPGLYQDDTSADVRSLVREMIGDGLTSAEATDRLTTEWAGFLEDDPAAERVFWLALADTQWRLGRLEDRVRDRAMGILQNGQALADWTGSSRFREREKVLSDLAARLRTAPPLPKKIRPVFRHETPWAVGDVLAYTRQSGRIALLHVTGVNVRGPGDSSATLAVFDVDADVITAEFDVSNLAYRRSPIFVRLLCLMRFSRRDRMRGEIRVVAHRHVKRERIMPCWQTSWTDLDDRLVEFGLS